MKNKELIYEYLDGELDPMLEEKLFAEMSVDQELRDEFSHQLKINKFALEDMNTMQVPSETTAAVFANLGFTIPTSVSAKKASPLLLFLKSKRFMKASIAVTAFVLSIASGWWLNELSYSPQAEISTAQACIVNTENTTSNATPNLTTDKSNLFSDNLYRSTRKSRRLMPIASTGLANDAVSNEINASNIVSNDEISNDIAQSEESFSNGRQALQVLSYSALNAIGGDFSFAGNETALFDYINLGNTNSDFETTLYTRGLRIAKELPVADDKSFFSGSSISIMYKLNDEHYIGGDFGEDEFYQEFYYQHGEQNVLYKQAPNYYWGAVSYKYLPEFLSIGDIAQPYAKLSLGGCKAGVIGKAQLGLNFQINQSLNAFIGGEYNSLFFNIRKDLYTSHKFELLYGISINL